MKRSMATRRSSHSTTGSESTPARATTGRFVLSRRQLDALSGWAFISPQLLGFLAFVAGPIIAVFFMAFTERSLLGGTAVWVGLSNFESEMASPFFRRTVLNSAVFAFGLVPINIGLALLISIALSRGVWGESAFRILFFLPVITSGVAWAIVWLFLLQGEAGPINQQLAQLGIKGPNWLRDPAWAMPAVVFTRALKTVGLKVIVITAAIRGIPKQLIEAARIEGASEMRIVTRIVMPLLAAILFVLAIWTFIGSFKSFDHILLMTNGGPRNATFVLVLYVYRMAFEAFDIGAAATASVVLFMFVMIITLGMFVLRKWFVYSER